MLEEFLRVNISVDIGMSVKIKLVKAFAVT